MRPRLADFERLLFLLSAVATASCGGGSTGAGTPMGVPSQSMACTTLTDVCYFPFPTNLATRAAPTATGLTLNLSAANFPSSATRALFTVYSPSLINDIDGFSSVAAIAMPLPQMPDPESLPAGPADSIEASSSIRMWDVERGEPVAFRALLDSRSAALSPPRAVLSILPQRPLRNQGTFIVLVTDRVRTVDGAPMPSFDGFARLLDPTPSSNPEVEQARAAYQPVFATMRGALGEDPAQMVLATVFTVRSDEPVTRKIRSLAGAIRERSRANPPRYRITSIRGPIPAIESRGVEISVEGFMTAPDYRDADRRIVWDAQGRPVEQREHELQFLLKLPKPGHGPAPVVVFGHGLGAFKETMFQITSAVGERGLATIGIDVGGHGSRIPEDGPIWDYFQFDKLLEARDIFLQTIADEMQLARLLEGPLGSLDVSPWGHPDGVPDLATGPIAYVGQSLGTLLGAAYMTGEPNIAAGVLNVPGGGFTSLMKLTQDLQSVSDGFLPPGATPLDRMVLFPVGQLLADDFDSANFGQHVTHDPFPGNRPKDVLMQESMDDGVVPNYSTELLAGSFDIPQVERALSPVFGLAQTPAPAESSGLSQFRVSNVGALNHGLLLSRPSVLVQLADFIESRLRTGTARIDGE